MEAVESYPPVDEEISGVTTENAPESGESKNDGTESSDMTAISAASAAEAIAKKMGVRFSHHRKNLRLVQRRAARKIQRKSGRSNISWEIFFLC